MKENSGSCAAVFFHPGDDRPKLRFCIRLFQRLMHIERTIHRVISEKIALCHWEQGRVSDFDIIEANVVLLTDDMAHHRTLNLSRKIRSAWRDEQESDQGAQRD